MKGILLTLVFGYTLLSTIGGPINSDPAPGRSPGPPNQKFAFQTSSSSSSSSSTSSSTSDSDILLNLSNKKNFNDKDINSSNNSNNNHHNDNANSNDVFIQNSHNDSNNNVHLNSFDTISSSSASNIPSSLLLSSSYTLSRTINTNNNNNNNNNNSNSNNNNSNNKNINNKGKNNNDMIEFSKLKLNRDSMHAAVFASSADTTTNAKCRQNYVMDSDKIVKLDYANEAIRWSFPLKLRIRHEIFYVDSGIFPSLIYTVELSQTTNIRIQDFFVESFTNGDEARGQFFSKFFNNRYSIVLPISAAKTPSSTSSSSYFPVPLTSSTAHKHISKNFWSTENFDDTGGGLLRPPSPPRFRSSSDASYTTINRKPLSLSSSSPSSSSMVAAVAAGTWDLVANDDGGGSSTRKSYKDTNFKWNQNDWNIENETNDDSADDGADDVDEGDDGDDGGAGEVDNNGDRNGNNNNNNYAGSTNRNDADDSDSDKKMLCHQNVWNGKWLYENKKLTMNWTLNHFNYNDKSDNIYFRILYRTMKSSNTVYEIIFPFRILRDCNLYLKNSIGYLDNTKIPVHQTNCTVYFPSDYNNSNKTSNKNSISTELYGLLIQLNRLNVPCQDGGYIKFNNQTKFICGKLEELTLSDRIYYFTSTTSSSSSSPSSRLSSSPKSSSSFSINLYKSPLFNLNYKLVDYCYNITYNLSNKTVLIQPKKKFECYFKIHLPYGNKILLNLLTNMPAGRNNYNASDTNSPVTSLPNEIVNLNTLMKQQQQQQQHLMQHQNLQLQQPAQYQVKNFNLAKSKCSAGLFIELIEITENVPVWYYCVDELERDRKNFTFLSNENILVIRVTKSHVTPPNSGAAAASSSSSSSSDNFFNNSFNNNSDSNNIELPSIIINYIAQSNETIVSQCAFGWIAYRQFCISAIEKLLTWHDAETECVQLGGHLPSIRTENEQNIIDQLLLNSPGYSDQNAYWIGASDKNLEGDFRWSDGIQFTYSNWFTGWAQHGHYNRQPNDDGLSSQDCVEIRRHFSVPPGGPPTPTPLSLTYKWNDRDCNAYNFFLCERPMTDVTELDEKGRTWDCNTTITLTRENSRVSVSSPGFPRQYQALQSCYTIITAPEGYRLILDFEELVLEAEPKCDYDYLEIFDIPKLNLQNDKLSTITSSSTSSSSSSASFNFNSTAAAAASNQQAQIIEFLASKKFRPKYILPDLSMYKNAEHNKQKYKKKLQNLGRGPRKVCGDWSSTLKLLRYVTQTPSIGLHFKSDYSNHLGGFKAKVSMENVASECSDERLKPYNGSCYLFVAYPEVSWKIAQQVCHSIGSQLASISSSDEQRFVTTNIRNHVDYTPRALYWLGGELAVNHEYEWTDGSKMLFKGWLPGQEIAEDTMPPAAAVTALKEPMCLALQWKTSPTPMLPSGLYWSSQKCSNVGGYVCKGQKHGTTEIFIQNQTITGIEGRLTSPGYPNIYPSNLDYWIHIIGPDRTRIILQFQKIDLELQDDCLYDYVSVRDYDPMLDTNSQYDPGLNSIPIAMLKNDHFYIDYQADEADDVLADDEERDAHEDDLGDIDDYDRREQNDNYDITKDLIDKNLELLRNGNGDDDDDILDKNIKKSFKKLEKTLRHRFGPFKKVLSRRRKRFLNSEQQISNEIFGDNVNINSDDSSSSRSGSGTPKFLKNLQLCGSYETDMSQFDYISQNNQAILHFHSDFSIAGTGFSATWMAVDISGCPLQTLTAREGYLSSPNYPHFLLNNLDCTFLIQAPVGKKVWLEINDYDLREDYDLTIDLGDGEFKPYLVPHQLNDGVFVSQREKLRIHLRTGNMPKGKGFRMIYKTMHPVIEDRTIIFLNTTHGSILHLNYPKSLAADVEFTQHLIAPMGENLLVELHGVELSEAACKDGNGIEIYDNYADNNGTIWNFCEISSNHSIVVQTYQTAPIYITSYLNSLHIRQKTSIEFHLKLNATVKIQPDVNFKLKLVKGDDWVETCQPNPCLFGGKCVSSGDKRACQCRGHYVGRFCGLTMCETDPCLFGKCELTASSFKCHCQPGYVGKTCDQRQKPCAESPCEGRGECFDKNGGFFCRCYAWWEGPRCEKRMINIPYKPLSERMLQEPFWLGLITVFIVLAIIGLVWCAKRHFPEKIEKLLSEEADRTRPFHSHHPSLREQLQFTSAIQQNAATTPASARTIFGRLGIRKPSILSLSSPHPPSGGATARTFSLDDLLRPPPRRTPSPRKKRNNSTPTKKNAAEKKQILQQLISPAINQTRPKVTLGELVQLSEQNRLRGTTGPESESDVKETTFSENSGSVSTTATRPISDPKFEKKVTFARLLNKVSAEISSGSELDIGNGNHNSSALSLPVEIPIRANSVPPSPSTNDMRSPHSTSSNQGSDSLSSSDLNLHLNLRNSRRIRPKVSSADSILAMFKNFASSTVSPSSKIVSPSTTPTASSPQDEVGDDDSSTSSIHTPVSFSSGPPDSPVFYRQSTIEVPVLDPLSAHKTNTASNLLHPPTILLEIPRDSNSIKCLSPIREMPTPMPSPALTPIMHRPNRLRQQNNISMDNPLPHNYTDDNDEYVIIEDKDHSMKHKPPMLEFKFNRDSEADATPTDTISTDESNASGINPMRKTRLQMKSPAIAISIDIDPPTPTELNAPSNQRDLIIPTLIVEQPSPTKVRPQFLMFPGSPPPQRASIGETSFMFPNKQQQKRLLKQFEKPTSLDLPFAPPMITITSNMSEIESDAESVSPAQTKLQNSNKLGLMPNNSVGMCYLSPFSICTRGDRTTSESNLSSSGYSSMASPGPSRCGSSNPLCPSETEDPGTGHGLNYHSTLPIRRPNPILKTCQENSENSGNNSTSNGNGQEHSKKVRRKSDSETLSDDPMLESNDEGIGTDHIDEKIEEGEIKSAKELELYIGKELIDNGRNLLNSIEETVTMSQLKLPSIVIQTESGEKGVSPVSSRSESPLSERTGMGRFSPLFYGRKDNQLPFTDSDGLYDFPSSDGKGNTVTHQRKSSKRRERKSSRAGVQHSPTKSSVHLEIPGKENPNTHHSHHHQNPKHYHHASLSTTRKSPKRRPIQRHPVASSSSSSENLTSVREVIHRTKAYPSTSTKLDYGNPPIEQKSPKVLSRDVSEEDTEEDVSSQILPKTTGTDVTRPQRKISRLRAIGHQIRFLRRLEQSIKQKERQPSPPDSSLEDCNDGTESPRVTSPLLQSTSSATTLAIKLNRPALKITRQKRLLCHPSTDKMWREREKSGLVHGDVTSD